MLVSDLLTPALLVDLDRLDANIAAMQARADAWGVRLRPHAKTHKTAEIAQRQLGAGAAGLTVATVAEAEAFAAAGVRDLLLATPVVTEAAFRRIDALREDGVAVGFTVDTLAGARRAAAYFGPLQTAVDVLIEVDTGHGRNGVAWDDPDAADLVAEIAALPGLTVAGVLTHGGHVYGGPAEGETAAEALARASAEERDRVLAFATRLGAAGLLLPQTTVVSLGSTPTISAFEPAERDGFRVTEIRPGNYVFGDAEQVALGSVAPRDCALVCVTTAISKHRGEDGTERVIVDAGKKTLTTDRPAGSETYGVVLYSPRTMVPNPHAAVTALSEEHGFVDTPGGSIYDVGDPVFVLPNHACVAVAARPRLVAVRGDEVAETWDVLAR